MRQYSTPQTPVRYDPVIVGSQSAETTASLKEYETQVSFMNLKVIFHGSLTF